PSQGGSLSRRPAAQACTGRLLGNAPQQNDARGRIEGGRSPPVGLTLGGYEGFSIWAREARARPLARRRGFSWRRPCSLALAPSCTRAPKVPRQRSLPARQRAPSNRRLRQATPG